MRLTRKIPGIRLPIPGREGGQEAPVSSWPPGVLLALVFVFLITVPVGTYLLLTAEWGQPMAVFWREPRLLGLSTLDLFTGANLLLAVIVLARFFLGRSGAIRWRRKRVVVYVLVLALLGVNQLYLRGWGLTVEARIDRALEDRMDHEREMRAARAELADLGAHPWAGEYSGTREEWSVHHVLIPDGRCLVREQGPDADHRNPMTLLGSVRDHDLTFTAEGAWLDFERYPRRGAMRILVVPWGERRYLVEPFALADFLLAARLDGPEGVAALPLGGVHLRVGDEEKAVEGHPVLPPDLAHLLPDEDD